MNRTEQNNVNKFFSDNRFNDENESVGYGHMMIPSSKKREDIEKPFMQFQSGDVNTTL